MRTYVAAGAYRSPKFVEEIRSAILKRVREGDASAFKLLPILDRVDECLIKPTRAPMIALATEYWRVQGRKFGAEFTAARKRSNSRRLAQAFENSGTSGTKQFAAAWSYLEAHLSDPRGLENTDRVWEKLPDAKRTQLTWSLVRRVRRARRGK